LLFPSLLFVILPFTLWCAVLHVQHRFTVESESPGLKAVGPSNLCIAALASAGGPRSAWRSSSV
jgi:hypothetical protein